MPVAERYRRQAALLIQVMPFVAAEKEFALKGGTAINLFVRDMPRISVDLDLTYLPVADRKTSLKAIDAAMKRIADAITAGMRGARVDASRLKGETCITRLDVRADNAQVKIEVTHARLLLSICSATTGRWRKSSHRSGSTFRLSTSAGSKGW